MHYSRDPPAICCYSTTILSVTRHLLSSLDELAREVQVGASPLSRFLSISGLASSQPKLTEWTEERLRSLLEQARRVRVRRNDLTDDFLYYRDELHYAEVDLDGWREYQEYRERRHYWDQALRCNYDWGPDLSSSLERLFSRTEQHLIRLEADNDGIKRAFEHDVPEVVTFEYKTPEGEIRYKTFLAARHSAEDVTSRNYALDDSTQLSSTPEGPVEGSSSSESRLEYENVLEYREINRHARRKIEAWLNDGWSVEWEWNGLYDEQRKVDNIWKHDAESWSVHQMTLRRSDENLPPSTTPSNERIVLEFPTTPKLPWDSDSDCLSDSDSDSE